MAGNKKKNFGQGLLGSLPEWWESHWKGMPEFIQNDLNPWKTIIIHFNDNMSVKEFSRVIDQNITNKTKSLWYPKVKVKGCTVEQEYIRKIPLNPRHPIYIISKGRWESRMTSLALEDMGVPYHIVIEPQEYDMYSSVINPSKIFVLPFNNLGQGSIPARNWCWEHSISIGATSHWIMDDNISKFWRMNRNVINPAKTGAIFLATEDLVGRYKNVAISGLQYFMFAPSRQKVSPFTLNIRIYSCILIKNDIPYRWRGRYNEDTDLSLRVLRDGWCTILTYAFLAQKTPTMQIGGGNTDELYKQNDEFDGRLEMAKSLQKQHPEVTKVTRKWGRWQHSVNYRHFQLPAYQGIKRNSLILNPGIDILSGIDNYGMELVDRRIPITKIPCRIPY